MTALAKDKSRRYPSAGACGQKLRSLRYSRDTTSGDPATERAKIIDSTEEVERQSQQMIAPSAPSGRFDFDGGETTVIRIRTADAFSARDNDASIVKARQVIARFEEEETRLAQLSGDQLKMLRSRNTRAPTAPPPMPPRSRGPTPGPPLGSSLPGMVPSTLPGGSAPIAPAPAMGQLPMAPPQGPPTGMPNGTPHLGPPTGPPTGPPHMGPPMGPPHMGPPMGPPQAGPPIGPNLGISGGALPFQPAPPAAQYPARGSAVPPQRPPRDATPTARDAFDRPVFPHRPSQPQVAGFGAQKKMTLKPWVRVVGARVMALLAFAITRAFIG